MIHIEGMGWLGAACAFRLAADDIGFTWHDTDTRHSAWRACTGAAHPAGDARSQANLTRWGQITPMFPPGTVAPATYCYTGTNPPHHGAEPAAADLGWIRVSPAACYTVDVPTIVAAARTQFAAARRDKPPPAARTVVAHGHTARRSMWVWGWSAPVRLRLPAALVDACPRRPALYARQHRFAPTYAYPVPGRPGWWWAGTSLMGQRVARPLNMAAHIDMWRRHTADLFPPVQILDIGPAVQGWRPRPRPGDSGALEATPGRAVLPPLDRCGVRWAPQLLDDVARWATTTRVCAR